MKAQRLEEQDIWDITRHWMKLVNEGTGGGEGGSGAVPRAECRYCRRGWTEALVPSPPPPISCAEMVISKVMVGDGAFGRCLGHGDRGLMNEISVLIKETPECSLALPPWRTQ